MFKPGFILSTPQHIEAAMHNRQSVSVWMDGHLVDYGGVIDEYRNGQVRINDAWHPLEIRDGDTVIYPCELRIR